MKPRRSTFIDIKQIKQAKMRTITKMASAIEPGDVMLIMDRVAIVTHNVAQTQRGAVTMAGPTASPHYIYWQAISFKWEDDHTAGVASTITVEGNRWVYTRDELDRPMPAYRGTEIGGE